MINLSQRIDVIRSLLQSGTDAALAYAALECRLSIEIVCYERLKAAYDSISYKDLKKWQPRHVVKQVVEDANQYAAIGLTLSFSPTPVSNDETPLTREDFEKKEYLVLGAQAPLDLAKIGKLWHSLSGAALHCHLPLHKDQQISPYGEPEQTRQLVGEAIVELEALSAGNLLIGSPSSSYSFQCVNCETNIKRIHELLRHGQVVNCFNPDCKESYQISKEGTETLHAQRTVSVKCEKCSRPVAFAKRKAEELRQGEEILVPCSHCEHPNRILLIPVHAKKKRDQSAAQQRYF